jgi:hypothetical protein
MYSTNIDRNTPSLVISVVPDVPYDVTGLALVLGSFDTHEFFPCIEEEAFGFFSLKSWTDDTVVFPEA